jgi:hypothetical protein
VGGESGEVTYGPLGLHWDALLTAGFVGGLGLVLGILSGRESRVVVAVAVIATILLVGVAMRRPTWIRIRALSDGSIEIRRFWLGVPTRRVSARLSAPIHVAVEHGFVASARAFSYLPTLPAGRVILVGAAGEQLATAPGLMPGTDVHERAAEHLRELLGAAPTVLHAAAPHAVDPRDPVARRVARKHLLVGILVMVVSGAIGAAIEHGCVRRASTSGRQGLPVPPMSSAPHPGPSRVAPRTRPSP